MSVALLSSTEFGLVCIRSCLEKTPGLRISGVVTTGPEISISYSESPVTISRHVEFGALAEEHHFPVVSYSSSPKPQEYLDLFKEWNAKVVLALGWYYMVPQRVLNEYPCFGIHASLLPKYRGGAPLVWAIINGETASGVSLFQLSSGVDMGPIAGQRRFDIGPNETISEVYAKAERASVNILTSVLPQLLKSEAVLVPQDESEATEFPQRSPNDGVIDWGCRAKVIHDFIRAQSRPYPGAFTYLDGKKLIVWRSAVTDMSLPGEVGSMHVVNNHVYCVAGDSIALELLDIEPESKEEGVDWLLGKAAGSAYK